MPFILSPKILKSHLNQIPKDDSKIAENCRSMNSFKITVSNQIALKSHIMLCLQLIIWYM